jgi:hypothetical protein
MIANQGAAKAKRFDCQPWWDPDAHPSMMPRRARKTARLLMFVRKLSDLRGMARAAEEADSWGFTAWRVMR